MRTCSSSHILYFNATLCFYTMHLVVVIIILMVWKEMVGRFASHPAAISLDVYWIPLRVLCFCVFSCLWLRLEELPVVGLLGWLPHLGFEEAFILSSILKNSYARISVLGWRLLGVGLFDLGFLNLQKYLRLSYLFCEVLS